MDAVAGEKKRERRKEWSVCTGAVQLECVGKRVFRTVVVMVGMVKEEGSLGGETWFLCVQTVVVCDMVSFITKFFCCIHLAKAYFAATEQKLLLPEWQFSVCEWLRSEIAVCITVLLDTVLRPGVVTCNVAHIAAVLFIFEPAGEKSGPMGKDDVLQTIEVITVMRLTLACCPQHCLYTWLS